MAKTTTRPLRQSIKKDRIHPSDFLKYKIPFACEDCSHFKAEGQTCTIGFWTLNHLKERQVKKYLLSGEMAICRFMEID